jgi:hypothetical protein
LRKYIADCKKEKYNQAFDMFKNNQHIRVKTRIDDRSFNGHFSSASKSR